MLIKKSQAILKSKFSVWFTLCSENETMFRDTYVSVKSKL